MLKEFIQGLAAGAVIFVPAMVVVIVKSGALS